MGTKLILLFLTILAFGVTETIQACVCAGTILSARDEAAEEFADAAVVFEGEVVPGGHLITAPRPPEFGLGVILFQVIRSYKGETGQIIEVYDDMAGSDCEFGQPEPGTKFFIYGSKGKDGSIHLRTCGRSARVQFAEADIRYARNEPAMSEDLEPPAENARLRSDPTLAERGATLNGFIRLAAGESVRDVVIGVWTLDDRGVRQGCAGLQKVKSDGTFEVRYLAPGVYVVAALDSRIIPVPRYVGESETLLLGEGQTVSSVMVRMRSEPVGTVRIRLVAPPQLRGRITVQLRDSEIDTTVGRPFPYVSAATPDVTNVAQFEGVPYGDYEVNVEITGDDLNRPSWTYNDLQVHVSGALTEAVEEMREIRKP